jgi:predicted GIY-YIG superfamily endonuclease
MNSVNTEAFDKLVKILPLKLNDLISSSPIVFEELPSKPKLSGVYVFFENDIPIYVGRTRNLRARLKSHYNLTNPNMASFVFLLASDSYGRKKASYKKEDSRKAIYGDEYFKNNHFMPANERLKKMKIRFIEINDPKEQHIFEIYAAMALGTEKYNSFDTH